MPLTLYDNPFSPFARKVRLVLSYKGIDYVRRDALALAELADLHAVNPRGEVPVLVEDDVVVVNSADIVAYLDYRYPEPPLLPGEAAARVAARAWERLADSGLDAIVHDISLWTWPTHRRVDMPPAGLVDAGIRDIGRILHQMDAALARREFVCGPLSVGDFALFPHVSSLKTLGIALQEYANVSRWNLLMREIPAVREDLDFVKSAARQKFAEGTSPYEAEKVVWRGDRLEWLFHNGFADWWYEELRAGRAVVPASL